MRYFLLAVLITLSNSFQAQQLTPFFENITDGLPSTEVHDMFQDSVGYMWFATDRGVCKYDGDKIRTIETGDITGTNVFFKFFKENETKIWLLTKERKLFHFNPLEGTPQFYSHPKNDQITKVISSSNYTSTISYAKFVGSDIILLFRRSPGYLLIPENGECEWMANQHGMFKYLENYTRLEIKKQDQIYFTQFSKSALPSSSISIELETKENAESIFIASDYGISAELETTRGKYFSISDLLIRYYNDSVSIVKMPGKILSLLELNDRIYVGTFNGIAVCNHELIIKNHLLKNDCITKMIIDKAQNFWASTINNGIYLSENLEITELKFDFDFNNSTITTLENHLLLHDDTKSTGVFIDEDFQMAKKSNDLIVVNNRIIFKNPDLLRFTKNLYPIRWTVTYDKIPTWDNLFAQTESENSFLIIGRWVHEMKNGEISISPFFKGNTQTNFCIRSDKENLLIGSNDGLYTVNIEKEKSDQQAIKGTENIRFYSAINLSGRIIISSSNGIYSYFNNELHHLIKGLSNKKSILLKRTETSAWIWDDHTVRSLQFHEDVITISEKLTYSTPKNAIINSFAEFKNHLWISTGKGIQVLDLDITRSSNEQSNATFILDSILLNSVKWEINSPLSILEENSLSLHFSYICFNQSTNRNMEYSIDGKTWFETNKRSILLSGLKAGDYTLQIRKVDEPKKILYSIPISVSRIWYKTYWFLTICTLTMLSLVLWFVYRFYKSRHAKTSAELETLNLELKLLTSKMNSHFTFNTINSIQYYILKSDKQEAIQYLSDFALLIRKSLDFSMTEQISITEELDFLELYLKLENKRFDSNFHLKVDCHPPNIEQRKIPSMLIQPLIENIILHAGYTENDSKTIRLKLIYEKGFFNIEVIDYGKGISPKQDLDKHKSYGIDILRSRVKIFNGNDYQNEDVTIHSNAQGTTVKIRIKEWIQ